MLDQLGKYIVAVADFLCGYPLFFLLIGGGLYLLISSGMVSLRRLPAAIGELRRKHSGGDGQISSVQALASVIAATVGLGNIAGVAIALVVGGPGAIFWMWVSAIVGMATKYHEGVLATMYKGTDDMGRPQGGPMHVITRGLGPRWTPMARFFAVAGLFGTLCIMNANQLTEAFVTTFSTPEGIEASGLLSTVGGAVGLDNLHAYKLLFGCAIAIVVAAVILGGITRIARVASVMVPFMVGVYFVMVLYIIVTRAGDVPAVFGRIFSEAFNMRAGLGALAGIAIIGARRAALVNDAGIGTASIMHGASRNNRPVREGLIAMLGPGIDSGLVCTLTAVAILLCVPEVQSIEGVKGLEVAMTAFDRGIPGGAYMLMFIVVCFAMSSMFSYSFYGSTCASYLFGSRRSRWYVYIFILSLVIFAVVPLEAAVGMCDLFYALMAFPTMISVLLLSGRVRKATARYFSSDTKQDCDA
ncbi:MAG: alanine:cation symporter family protein [Bacteroides sp.]|nr:alanine:cation symporter family protein [Bacteroides sp.]MCM1095108.1 alanine:cation symporter family protein [Terasakiella sp.]